MVDKQGLTGKKVRTTSFPYSKIVWFSVENAGVLDLDGELDIKIAGDQLPFCLKFGRSVDLGPIVKQIAGYILHS